MDEQPKSVADTLDQMRLELRRLHDLALEEVIDAIRVKLDAGQVPERVGVPEVSIRDNGMAWIGDKPFLGRNGPLEYSTVLEPPYGDDAARREGRFPKAKFPALHALQKYVIETPESATAYGEGFSGPIAEIVVQFGVEKAANAYFLRYGNVKSTVEARAKALRRLFVGLFEKKLKLAVAIPIALTKFAFDRLRLDTDAFIVRMSKGLQQARWDGKAYGAGGHNSVLASATHALILTGWSIENDNHLTLGQRLSQPTPKITEIADSFFAALRLDVGIATGYAQELLVAREWRMHETLEGPQVYAVGARRYPADFDNFGWSRDSFPEVTRDQMKTVAKTWRAIRRLNDPRLNLALRRLNAAMTRDDNSDSILDATIALEILLGDSDGQAISWKLRMRAAALKGLHGQKADMEAVSKAVRDVYGSRSAIVHGVINKQTKALDHAQNANLAVATLREVLKSLIENPQYLDPLKIDSELLMSPKLSDPGE